MTAPRPYDWEDPVPERFARLRLVAFVALGWALPLVVAAHVGLALQ